MSMYETDWKKEAQHLQDELDRREYEARRERERESEQREYERQQRAAEAAAWQCYADSWDDAFRKSIPRLANEASEEKRFNAANPDSEYKTTFFQEQLEQAKFAQRVYQEEMAFTHKLISKLEQRARERAAKRVEEQYPDAYVAANLREDDFTPLVEW